MKKKIYVACSLTGAPLEFINEVNQLKDLLRQKYIVLDFLGVDLGNEKEVALHDSKCVRECDLLLAVCTLPATGLGIELGLAIGDQKLTLAVALKDTTISRFVLGLKELNPNFIFTRYKSHLLEVAAYVDELFKVVPESIETSSNTSVEERGKVISLRQLQIDDFYERVEKLTAHLKK